MPNVSRDKIFLNIAFSLLLGIFSIYMLSSLGFILGLPINIGYILVAIVLLVYIPRKCYKTNIYETLLSLAAIIITIMISYFCAAKIADFSYDGPWYHQTGILFLKKGWNPIYTSAEYFFNNNWNAHIEGLVWIDSYPKFCEIFAANIFYLTDSIESGKILNFLSLTALFFYVFYVLEKKLLKNKPLVCFAFSLLLTCNPIVLAQIYTYYVDGLVYIYFMFLLLSLIDIQQSGNNNKTAHFISIMSATFLANLKLGGLFYTILILTLYAFFRYLKKQKLKTLGKDCVIIALLILLTGINPYITNLYKGKHIFYPIAGSEKTDIMSHNMPTQFFNKSMPYKLFMSTFSKVDASHSEFKSSDTEIQLKIPFTFDKSEMEKLKLYDVRQCGFGIFWSGILIITLILSFFIHIKDKQQRYLYYFITTLLLISVLINPENWWARYVPQFYALPIFILMFYYITSSSSRWRFVIIFITGMLIFINSAVLFWKICDNAWTYTSIKNMQLENMHRERRNRRLVKFIETQPVQKNFTAPILLFLDEANGK